MYENTNAGELKTELKDLYINSALQIDVSGNRKAVVIHVPYRLRKAFQKIHVKLVRELEKKFSGKDVILIATQRILRPPKKGSAVQRPRSRTLTVVHDAVGICSNFYYYRNLKDLCLEGTISPELGNLTRVNSIVLRNNSFSGAIPKEMKDLEDLEAFRSPELNELWKLSEIQVDEKDLSTSVHGKSCNSRSISRNIVEARDVADWKLCNWKIPLFLERPKTKRKY
ncbi:hypothetical protein IFM89_010537 [Coptis chinensis]|uniref:40S ribosomal protein S7 n=1 Tax=Coptis chinensis TaxID=261450 RepID=A0A835H5I2_9MAGN|nr:hypothetical protein IFM89_010537 [Coptis chinensis]